LAEQISSPYSLWLGTLDKRLNELSYIVPGLGDAGDLAFGEKQ
jgi:uracil phosphoribosyltransferase